MVVTLVGTVDQEGARQHRADAFPVRVVDGTATLEPFAFAGELEVVVPEERARRRHQADRPAPATTS